MLELTDEKGVRPLDVFTALLAALPLCLFAVHLPSGGSRAKGARAVTSELAAARGVRGQDT